MRVVAVHGDPDRDAGEHKHRKAHVPIRDPDREHHHQDDPPDASDPAGGTRSLADSPVRASRVRGDTRPEAAREPVTEVETHAPFCSSGPSLPAAERPADNEGLMPVHNDAAPLLTDRFAAALSLAWEVHGTQLRKKTDIPYMAHVMAVCALALENGADEDAGIAALLHDSVEDSDDGAKTLARIEREFGPRVARVVLACSDTVAVPGRPKPPWRERKETYLHHLETEADRDALLVSACDKVHNASSIVADLRSTGHDVWQRFTVADPSAQLWYYRSVAGILQRRLPGPLTARLGTIVDEMSALVP